MIVQCHLDKVKLIAVALSQNKKSVASLAQLSGTNGLMAKEIQTLESMFMQLVISERGGLLASIETKSTFVEEIKAKKLEGGDLHELRKKNSIGKCQ